ncbi:TPA: hypothetical protein U1D18_000074 [Streptococcus suis]|nr:hypothetical protein [Streptococcus suis]
MFVSSFRLHLRLDKKRNSVPDRKYASNISSLVVASNDKLSYDINKDLAIINQVFF